MGSDRNGPGDLVVRGIAAIVTCVLFVFVLVFFTNRGAFSGRGNEAQTTAATGAAVTVETEGKPTEFGIQIGDNLKAFIHDDSFFDDHYTVPVTETYTEEEVISVSILVAYEDARLVIRLFDNTGKVVAGVRFKALISRADTTDGTVHTFTDDDSDGVIYAMGLGNGEWNVRIEETDGYHVPAEPAKITIGT